MVPIVQDHSERMTSVTTHHVLLQQQLQQKHQWMDTGPVMVHGVVVQKHVEVALNSVSETAPIRTFLFTGNFVLVVVIKQLTVTHNTVQLMVSGQNGAVLADVHQAVEMVHT